MEEIATLSQLDIFLPDNEKVPSQSVWQHLGRRLPALGEEAGSWRTLKNEHLILRIGYHKLSVRVSP